jgi:threonyl-tRNA synthetase
VQVAVLPIADRHVPYADEVAAAAEEAGLRAVVDRRQESVSRKIAEAEARHVPVMLVVGDREAEAGQVAVRRRGRRDLGTRPLAEVLGEVTAEAERRALQDV